MGVRPVPPPWPHTLPPAPSPSSPPPHPPAVDAAWPSKRSEFAIPPTEEGARYRTPGTPAVYLCGNSLGLMPARTRTAIVEELDKWSAYGVEGHFRGERPWVSIEDTVVPLAEALVGAQPGETPGLGAVGGWGGGSVGHAPASPRGGLPPNRAPTTRPNPPHPSPPPQARWPSWAP